MCSILDQIFTGDLVLNEITSSDEESKRCFQAMDSLEAQLTERLAGEERTLFLAYTNACSEWSGYVQYHSTMLGLRTGAKLASELLF